ncbi:TIR domain-containing protein [Nonlabens sp. YIK11]|uniref:TIR domain-containing protein n=1 Tax=Nonlabens sp. YIK11 TaxID=1453349 RepID=UPI0006DC9E81|nr:TIR domain-containing protein [Nonlabens sp. YIK11]
MIEENKVTIFYSWQSDLPKGTNQNAIRKALRSVANKLEDVTPETQIILDEATRNTSGSPNIPMTIFSKISSSDIFICDLTTINRETSDFRKVPNPNVLIELGYAIAEIGWERIIILFNETFGSFPNDLPFDIDRHRASRFAISDTKDKNGIKNLTALLSLAIEVVVEQNPPLPAEKRKENTTGVKKELDIKKLRECLKFIHIPSMDLFLDEIPDRILKRTLTFYDNFKNVIESNSFYIYDNKLSHLINKFSNEWEESLKYGHQYDGDRSENFYEYYLPMDRFPNERSQKEYEILKEVSVNLRIAFRELLNYIRINFLMIDLDASSEEAWNNYLNRHIK